MANTVLQTGAKALQTPPSYPLQQVPTFDMGTVLTQVASGAGTYSTGPLYVQHFKGVTGILNVTSFGGATLTFVITGYDPTSGNTFTLLTSGAITSTATTAFTIYPGINQPTSAPANASTQISTILPTYIGISVTVAGGTASFTAGALLTT